MSITSHGRSDLDGSNAPQPPRRHTNPALARLPRLVAVTDLALILLTGVIAAVGRAEISLTRGPLDQSDLAVAGPLVLLAWVAAIALSGGYRTDSLGTGPEEYGRVLNASLITFGVVGVGCYLAKYDLARSFYLLTFAVGIPLLLLGRWMIRRALHSARRRGHLQMKVLIAGTRSHVDDVARVLSREQWLGYSVAGALLPADDSSVETPAGVPVIGTSGDVARVSGETDADVIIFAGGVGRARRATCGARCGPSSSSRSGSSWRPASATSLRTGSASGPSAASRSSTWSGPRGLTPPGGASAPSTWSGLP